MVICVALYRYVCIYISGNFDPEAFDGLPAPLQKYGLVLSCIYMMVVVVLMLNLLIALMGDSFAQVAEDGMAQWRLEQTRLLLENEYMMSQTDRDQCDHVLFFEHRKGSSSLYACTPQERGEGENEMEGALLQIMEQQKVFQDTLDKMVKRLEQ